MQTLQQVRPGVGQACIGGGVVASGPGEVVEKHRSGHRGRIGHRPVVGEELGELAGGAHPLGQGSPRQGCGGELLPGKAFNGNFQPRHRHRRPIDGGVRGSGLCGVQDELEAVAPVPMVARPRVGVGGAVEESEDGAAVGGAERVE